jgi:hypothetical protein
MSTPSRPIHPDPPTYAKGRADERPPAVMINIVVRNDVARDVVVTINGIPIIGGVDDEP